MILVRLLLVFVFGSIVASDENCFKTDCDVLEKAENMESSLGQWFHVETNNREKSEERIFATIDKHHNNITSFMTNYVEHTNNVIDAFNKKLEVLQGQVNEKFSKLEDMIRNLPVTIRPIIPTYSHKCGIIDCWSNQSLLGYLVLNNGHKVKCSAGWTSVMSIDYLDNLSVNKTWTEYNDGFGNLDGSHWTGLKVIADIMSQRPRWQLKVTAEAKDSSATIWTGIYHETHLDATNNYTLRRDGTISGTDLLLHGNIGYPFTTKDRDNDKWGEGNWALKNGGGFWYSNPGYLQHKEYKTGSIGIYNGYELSRLKIEIRPY